MEFIALGRTGLTISRLGFGAGQLKILDRDSAIKLLALAMESGINYFDIDKGNDETLVAEAQRLARKDIITVGKSFATSREGMEADIREYLKNYGTDMCDLYLVHAVMDSTDLRRRMGGPLEALENARSRGEVRFFGITSNRIEVLREAVETGIFDVICVPFNITHRTADNLLVWAREKKIGVISFQTFGSGTIVRPGKESLLSYHDPLRFSLSYPGVHSVLIGTNKEEHLRELLTYAETVMGGRMTDTEVAEATERIISILGKGFCRGCRYCIKDGDSHKLEIDQILRLKTLARRLGEGRFAQESYREVSFVDPEKAFSRARNPDWPCPYHIEIERELHETHRMFMEMVPSARRRILGRTGLHVSPISFGGGAFNKKISDERIWEVVSEGLDRGVNLIETAEDYGEEKFALALRKAREAGKPLIICSKSVARTYDEMNRSVGESLRKLNTRHIHLYLLPTIMSPEDFQSRSAGGALRALLEAKEEGRIGAIGVSSHRRTALIAAIRSGNVDVIEDPYSIGQYDSRAVLKEAHRQHVGVLAIMTLAGGILVDRDKSSPFAESMAPRNALRYVLADSRVHSALVGMGSKEHVTENLRALEGPLPSWFERRRIERTALSLLGEDFCRSCKACMPCDVFGWSFSIDNLLRFGTFKRVYGYDHYAQEYGRLPVLADACTGCGKCEPRCPYNVPILEQLNAAHSALGGGQTTDRTRLPRPVLKSVEEYLTRELEQFRRLGEFHGGVDFLKSQEQYFPHNPVLLRNLGECYMELENYGGAVRYLDEARKLSPQTEWLHFSLGKCYHKQGKNQLAIQMFKENLRYCTSEESHFHSWYFMAGCHRRQRRDKEMWRCYRRAQEFTGHFGKHEIVEEQELKEFIDKWPSSYFEEEFRHLRETGRYRQGIAFGREQLKDHLDNEVLHHYLGEFYMEIEAYNKAIFHLSKAIDINPAREWTRFSLGKCLFLQGKLEKAEAAFRSNIALTADQLSHFHSWIFLAMSAEARRDPGARDKALNRAREREDLFDQTTPLEQAFLLQLEKQGLIPGNLLRHSSQKVLKPL